MRCREPLTSPARPTAGKALLLVVAVVGAVVMQASSIGSSDVVPMSEVMAGSTHGFGIDQPATVHVSPDRNPERVQVIPSPSDPPSDRPPPESGAPTDVLNLDSVSRRVLGSLPHQAVVYRSGKLHASTSSADRIQRSASLSKMITAAALFVLVDRNQVELQTNLLTLFPDAHGSFASISIQQLLAHQSGIPAERNRWFGGDFTSCEKAAGIVLTRGVRSTGLYQYSNTNYCLLSLVIAAITKKDYREAVFELVFRPLDISTPVFDPDYLRLAGAGAWKISPIDIGKLLVSLDPEADSPHLLSKSSALKMIGPSSNNYGHGMWRWPNGSFGHSGTLNLARNIAVRLNNKDVVVIMAQTNSLNSGLDLFARAQSISSSVSSG